MTARCIEDCGIRQDVQCLTGRHVEFGMLRAWLYSANSGPRKSARYSRLSDGSIRFLGGQRRAVIAWNG